MNNERSTFLDLFFIALIVVGLGGGVAFSVIPFIAVAADSALFFSISLAGLAYYFMGGIKSDDSFVFAGIKLTGSVAVLLAFFYFVNMALEKQQVGQGNRELSANFLKGHKDGAAGLEIKAGPIKVGEIDADKLNNADYHYIKDPKVVDALDSLERSDPPYEESPVLDKIRNECKKLRGVCEYKFKVKVFPKTPGGTETPDPNKPKTSNLIAGICEPDFWENRQRVDISQDPQFDKTVSIILKGEQANVDFNYKCNGPKKIYLFRDEDLRTLGIDPNSADSHKGTERYAMFNP